MGRRASDDAGQAFPIYIMVVAGLLFLAFAYLAVGQAAANRNGAQTAADAAALAAAQETRDLLAADWRDVVADPAKWQEIFDGDGLLFKECWRAEELADQNDANVEDCGKSEGRVGYTVVVEANESVGDSIVPGTEDYKSTATATAVIEPLCDFDLPGGDGGEGDEGDEGDGNDTLPLPQLTCDDGEFEPDPDDPDTLPHPEDLFDVHLAD
ncbi:pilus assembly protein TadG-related protein [Streptomyces lanatus]